jgi:hypothetical protein
LLDASKILVELPHGWLWQHAREVAHIAARLQRSEVGSARKKSDAQQQRKAERRPG